MNGSRGMAVETGGRPSFGGDFSLFTEFPNVRKTLARVNRKEKYLSTVKLKN